MRQGLFRIAALVVLYSAMSLAFSLLSVDRWNPHTPTRELGTGELLHLAQHLMAGLLVAAPCRRLDLAGASGLLALALDVDHLGAMSGLATVGRASHALAFLILATVAVYAAARWHLLPRGWPPLLVATITLASGLSHIAVDAWPEMASAPLFLPFAETQVRMGRWLTVPLLGAGFALVAGASFLMGRGGGAERASRAARLGD